MKTESQRLEKRPRIKSSPKQIAILSTNRLNTAEASQIFASNIFKKKDPFTR